MNQSQSNTPPNLTSLLRHCSVCGSPFIGGAANRRYCGRACRHKAFRDKEKTGHVLRDPLMLGVQHNPTMAELRDLAHALRHAEPGTHVALTGSIPVPDLTDIEGATVVRQADGRVLLLRMQGPEAPPRKPFDVFNPLGDTATP